LADDLGQRTGTVLVGEVHDRVTADRDEEIEHYRSLEAPLSKYIDQPTWDRPLCLSVFGPPGVE